MKSTKSFKSGLERLLANDFNRLKTVTSLTPNSVLVENQDGAKFNFLLFPIFPLDIFGSEKFYQLEQRFKEIKYSNSLNGIYTGIFELNPSRGSIFNQRKSRAFNLDISRFKTYSNVVSPNFVDELVVKNYLDIIEGETPVVVNEFNSGKFVESKLNFFYEDVDENKALHLLGFKKEGFSLVLKYIQVNKTSLKNYSSKIIFEEGNFEKLIYINNVKSTSSALKNKSTTSRSQRIQSKSKLGSKKNNSNLFSFESDYEVSSPGKTVLGYDLIPYTGKFSNEIKKDFSLRNRRKSSYYFGEVPLSILLAYDKIHEYYASLLKPSFYNDGNISIKKSLSIKQLPSNYRSFERENSDVPLPSFYNFRKPVLSEDDFKQGRLSPKQIIDRNKEYLHHLQQVVEPHFDKIISSAKKS